MDFNTLIERNKEITDKIGKAITRVFVDELGIAEEEVKKSMSFYVDLTQYVDDEPKQTLAFARTKHIMHYMVIAAGNLMQLADIEIKVAGKSMAEAIDRACAACRDFMRSNYEGMESHRNS